MAAADYWLCDWCGSKAFYDATLDYPEGYRDIEKDGYRLRRTDRRMLPRGCGDAQVLCKECAEEHEVVIVKRSEARAHVDAYYEDIDAHF